MSAKQTSANVGKKNLANISWKIDSTKVSQKIVPVDVNWQIFPTYFDKKTPFDVDLKIALVDVGFKHHWLWSDKTTLVKIIIIFVFLNY